MLAPFLAFLSFLMALCLVQFWLEVCAMLILELYHRTDAFPVAVMMPGFFSLVSMVAISPFPYAGLQWKLLLSSPFTLWACFLRVCNIKKPAMPVGAGLLLVVVCRLVPKVALVVLGNRG